MNGIDRNANDHDRHRRNWQRLADRLLPTAFVFNEVPAGTVNGVNVTFTLAATPLTGTVQLFKDGLLLKPTTNYSVSGLTITFVVAPAGGSVLLAHYLR